MVLGFGQALGGRLDLGLRVNNSVLELPGTFGTKSTVQVKHSFSKGLRVEAGRSDLQLDSTCKMLGLSGKVLKLEGGLG